MKNFFQTIMVILIILFLVAASFYSLMPHEKTPINELDAWKKLGNIYLNAETSERIPVAKEVLTDINAAPLKDNLALYQDDQPGSVVVMYLTVRKGQESNNTGHGWDEVNSYIKSIGSDQLLSQAPQADAILQIGDEVGPLVSEFGYGVSIPNASVSVRGNTTTLGDQKSYKIELRGKQSRWRGQKTIALNKHIFDTSRMLNKLSFDLMKDIPDMVSLRTQFVHLYVKDETKTPAEVAFQDYGLFTQVEQPNKTFLQNHLLDPNGQLYKATFFEFYRYPDEIRLVSDPLFDVNEFSRILEIKGNNDHSKLTQMLDDVNNSDIPIEDTFQKYFNANNYFTWMAFNILTGNIDTDTQNFYLYSPENGDKWYFIPWDYDGAFSRQKDGAETSKSPWRQGFCLYWGDVLHQRVLSEPKYRKMLDQKINELLPLLTADKISELLETYYPVTREYVSRMPDIKYVRGSVESHDLRYTQIPDEIQINYNLYLDSLMKPMPFFLSTPTKTEDQVEFNWDSAYDLDHQKITYQFMIATDPDFKNVLINRESLISNSVKVPLLKPGPYYWQVTAENADGEKQGAFDVFIDNEGGYHFGVKFLYVTPDSQLLENEVE